MAQGLMGIQNQKYWSLNSNSSKVESSHSTLTASNCISSASGHTSPYIAARHVHDTVLLSLGFATSHDEEVSAGVRSLLQLSLPHEWLSSRSYGAAVNHNAPFPIAQEGQYRIYMTSLVKSRESGDICRCTTASAAKGTTRRDVTRARGNVASHKCCRSLSHIWDKPKHQLWPVVMVPSKGGKTQLQEFHVRPQPAPASTLTG